jgi:hypothetical protein
VTHPLNPKDMGEQAGELIPFDDTHSNVIDTPDGGAIIVIDEGDDGEPGEFYANLADENGPIEDGEATRLGALLLELIDRDKEARKRRDEQYEEGLKRTGLGDEAPGGASFQGASKVVHPMMTEACIDFASRTMKELFPSEGPAKMAIPGKFTDERIAKARRKSALMNWQLTIQCPEFRAELEQTMTQVPLGGSQYTKHDWDKARNRPRALFVAIDDMLLPYAATNFYSAQRKTHVQYLTQVDYEERVRDGMYRDVDLAPSGMDVDQTGAGRASDRIEGREQTSYNEDGLRTVFECHVIMEIEGDDQAEGSAPYIVTIDKPTNRVLSIYRNWAEDDESREEMQWFVEWPFIPWRGAYAIGLPQMIGGLSAAATGALRALLDSAHANNALSMLKLKGAKIGGQTQSVQPGQIVEIEGGVNVDDIRKVAMPMPYNPPSGVLFSLLGFLVEAGQGVVRTSMDNAADSNPNAPVGTTLANMEQGMVVYSAIHARLHQSMARTLRILHRLNADNLDDSKLDHEVGEDMATRADFEGPMDVVPVSDPNIYSEAQRFAQVQAVSQRAAANPALYNARKVEERLLQTLRIPDYESLLSPAIEPKEQNAVNENVTATMGKPVTAFPDQDHLAHIQAHLSYMTSPMYGMSTLIAPAFLPVMINHLKEHMAWWYASAVFDAASKAIGRDVGDMLKEMADDQDDKSRKLLDKLLAQVGTMAVEEAQQTFASLPHVIDAAHKFLQQFQPHPDANPAIALETQKLQQQQQADAQDAQLGSQKLQLEQQKAQAAAEQEQQHDQAEAARQSADLQAREAINRDDNETALTIAGVRAASHTRPALNPNPNPNPTPEL